MIISPRRSPPAGRTELGLRLDQQRPPERSPFGGPPRIRRPGSRGESLPFPARRTGEPREDGMSTYLGGLGAMAAVTLALPAFRPAPPVTAKYRVDQSL